MSEILRSPTPWEQSVLHINDAEGNEVVRIFTAAFMTVDSLVTGNENLSRIVAAVNATANIPTESLEAGVIQELIKASSDLANSEILCGECCLYADGCIPDDPPPHGHPDVFKVRQLLAQLTEVTQ